MKLLDKVEEHTAFIIEYDDNKAEVDQETLGRQEERKEHSRLWNKDLIFGRNEFEQTCEYSQQANKPKDQPVVEE